MIHFTARYLYCILLSWVILFIPQEGCAQISAPVISAQFEATSLDDAISDLETRYPIKFYFKEEWIKDYRVTVTLDSVSTAVATQLLLSETPLHFSILDQHMIIITKVDISDYNSESIEALFSVGGVLTDGNTGAGVPGTLYFSGPINETVNTNESGTFQVELPYGRYDVKAVGQGSFERNFEVNLYKDSYLELEMLEKTIELEDVVITGSGLDDNITATNSGRVTVNIETLSSMPAFLGEIDITRAVINIPGVSSVGEGATGFNVRGGNLDQNLILMDNIPLYNSSHMLGFFSVFNPDMVQSFTLHKGSMPSRYGGKISSVLQVKQKISAAKDFKFKASAGFVTSKLFMDIPLVEDRSGLLVAARGAYPGWIIEQIDDLTLRQSNANYFDTNIKYHYQFGQNNLFEIAGYYSTDDFSFASDTVFGYQTKALSIGFQQVFSHENTINWSASYSDYDAEVESSQIGRENLTETGITQLNSKFSYLHNQIVNHQIEVGADINYYKNQPGIRSPANNSSIIEKLALSSNKALETSVFFHDEISLTPEIRLMLGLRYSQFYLIGAGEYPVFNPLESRSVFSIIDTLSLASGSLERIAEGFEPRAALNFTLDPSTAVKIGYNRTRQYIHLFSNTVASLPTDPWRFSGPSLRPLVGDQVTLGFYKNFNNNRYETSIEGFYKEIEDIIDFKDGTQVLMNAAILSNTLQGKARSQGVELSINKNTGDVRGRLGYTYSKSEITFDSPFPLDQLNQGAEFPANFDRPHQLSLDTEFKVSRLWSISGSFTFNSGRPVTLPASSFALGNVRVFSDISRNNFRIPDYHRLDLAVTLKGSNRKDRKFEHSWTFSVYNVYARKNPFSVFLNAPNGVSPRVFQLSVLGTAFPSLTYNIELK